MNLQETIRRQIYILSEEKNKFDNVIRIYANGGGSDPGDNIPHSEIKNIKISETIPNEPFKDLSYMKDSDNAKDMIDSIKKGKKLPPIMVIKHPKDKTKYLVVDGNHRRFAFMKAGSETIPGVVIPYTNVLLMKKKWGSKNNAGVKLSTIEDTEILDRYFVQPNGKHKFTK